MSSISSIISPFSKDKGPTILSSGDRSRDVICTAVAEYFRDSEILTTLCLLSTHWKKITYANDFWRKRLLRYYPDTSTNGLQNFMEVYKRKVEDERGVSGNSNGWTTYINLLLGERTIDQCGIFGYKETPVNKWSATPRFWVTVSECTTIAEKMRTKRFDSALAIWCDARKYIITHCDITHLFARASSWRKRKREGYYSAKHAKDFAFELGLGKYVQKWEHDYKPCLRKDDFAHMPRGIRALMQRYIPLELNDQRNKEMECFLAAENRNSASRRLNFSDEKFSEKKQPSPSSVDSEPFQPIEHGDLSLSASDLRRKMRGIEHDHKAAIRQLHTHYKRKHYQELEDLERAHKRKEDESRRRIDMLESIQEIYKTSFQGISENPENTASILKTSSVSLSRISENPEHTRSIDALTLNGPSNRTHFLDPRISKDLDCVVSDDGETRSLFELLKKLKMSDYINRFVKEGFETRECVRYFIEEDLALVGVPTHLRAEMLRALKEEFVPPTKKYAPPLNTIRRGAFQSYCLVDLDESLPLEKPLQAQSKHMRKVTPDMLLMVQQDLRISNMLRQNLDRIRLNFGQGIGLVCVKTRRALLLARYNASHMSTSPFLRVQCLADELALENF